MDSVTSGLEEVTEAKLLLILLLEIMNSDTEKESYLFRWKFRKQIKKHRID